MIDAIAAQTGRIDHEGAAGVILHRTGIGGRGFDRIAAVGENSGAIVSFVDRCAVRWHLIQPQCVHRVKCLREPVSTYCTARRSAAAASSRCPFATCVRYAGNAYIVMTAATPSAIINSSKLKPFFGLRMSIPFSKRFGDNAPPV